MDMINNMAAGEEIKPEKQKSPTKKWHIIYLVIIGVLVLGGVAGFLVLNKVYDDRYRDAVAEQKEAYETSKAQYDSAYREVLQEEAGWKQTLETTQAALNEANTELQGIYDERQAAIDAETARWNAMSADEQAAEKRADEYNEMVSYLRANNSEYAELYVLYAQYLDKDIFNLGKEEALTYTQLHNRMIEIENAYRDAR